MNEGRKKRDTERKREKEGRKEGEIELLMHVPRE